MKKDNKPDKVKEAELNLNADELLRDKKTREKYNELTAEIDGVISELKDDQEEMNKKMI